MAFLSLSSFSANRYLSYHLAHMHTHTLLIVPTEALMAYIGIQPELIQELVDLIRVRTDQSAQMTVPLDISVLAVHCLAALVHTRYVCTV